LRFSLLPILLSLAEAGAAQSPRAANPERPTVATHAYAVAPGYGELEQGIALRGVRSLGEATSWDLNLKLGLARGWQRALGALVGVMSADVAPAWHMDINLGPTGIGVGKPQWFGSTGVTWSRGAAALTMELFGFTSGGGGPRQSGVLVAVLITPGEWVVADAGGVWGAAPQTPNQVFLGLTTNLGRIFE